MSKIDWTKLEKMAEISPEEQKRLDSPSSEKCPCGNTMTVGYAENFGLCETCVDNAYGHEPWNK